MVDDLWSMACGLWSMVDVNWLTHGVTNSPVCLHRESNEVVQAVDRQFGFDCCVVWLGERRGFTTRRVLMASISPTSLCFVNQNIDAPRS